VEVRPPTLRTVSRGTRLDGWKEIAVYVGRSVRTVQRWERERGLPVHRFGTGKGGTVFAYPEELDAWHAALPGATGTGERPAAEEAAEPLRTRATARRRLFTHIAGCASVCVSFVAQLVRAVRVGGRAGERWS